MTKEKEETFYKKHGTFFKVGGIALIIWGTISVLVDLKIID